MIQAAPPPPPAQEIVVTGSALPQPLGARTLAVTTIGRAELEQAASSQLDQVLKSVPGLQLFRRSDARSAHPTSQGVTLRALGGNASSRALLLLDGVPQADPFGGWVNWPAFDPAALGAVRVTRGGGSVAFGPGALAGVIELDSRAPSNRPRGEIAIGSRDALEGRAGVGADVGQGAFDLSGRLARGDGFVPIVAAQRGPADRRAPYEEASVRARAVAPFGGDIEAQLSGLAFSDRRDRGVDFTDNRTRGADAALRLVGSGRWRWSALGYGQWRGFESSFASVDRARTRASRVSLQDDVPSSALGGSFELRPPVGDGVELRLGGDVRAARGHSHELTNYVAGSPTRDRDSGGGTRTAGLFGEGAKMLGPLTLTAGGRLDRWHIGGGKLVERTLATGTVLTDARYAGRSGWLPTARGGASLAAAPGLELRGAAYLGWRLPTLNELFRPFRAGSDATAANPLLDPERLRGVEVGARFARGGVGFDATLFANRLSHSIANVTLGAGPGQFPGVGFVAAGGKYRQRRNIGAVAVRGLELDGWAKRGAFSLRGGYSFANAETNDGVRPAQTPRHSGSASLSFERAFGTLSLSATHVGGQFEDDLNLVELPPATSIDAFAALRLGGRLQLIVRAENLSDERIVAGIAGDGTIERATPRTLSIGLRLRD